MVAAALQNRPPRITLKDVLRRMDSQQATLNDVVKGMKKMNGRMHTQEEMFRSVISHMSHMEQRLTKRLDKHDEKIDANTTSIVHLEKKLTERIDDLAQRITYLDEDLVAVMKDSIIIRKHVGMPVPEDD